MNGTEGRVALAPPTDAEELARMASHLPRQDADGAGVRLIRNADRHQFMMDYLHAFEQEFLAAFPEATAALGAHIQIKRQLLRVFRRAYRPLHFPAIGLPQRWRRGKTFCVLCGNDFAYCLPSALVSKSNYLYIFDAWPRSNRVLVDWVKLFSIEKVFFSALQSADLFNRAFPAGQPRGFWVPEAIRAQDYACRPYEEKNIDVFEFGRRYDAYHDRIAPLLKKQGYAHLWGHHQLRDPLSRTRISICFPSTLTHPARSEYVSTMTLRYLESMVSKCLIVGSAPYDMQFLFDHQPVIEADMQNPGEQLIDILEHYADYIPLIEKNYQAVMRHHLWRHRMNTIREHIL